ncbi:MAG: PAS domain-containing protein [Paludibacter sp.]
MSEFTTHQTQKLVDLTELFEAIVYKRNAAETIHKFQLSTIADVTPDDVVVFVHRLVESGYSMEDIKSGINKLLNVLRKPLDDFPYEKPESDSFFGVCIQNNEEVINCLNKIRPFILEINKKEFTEKIKIQLISLWQDVQKFTNYYLIKENIIFPLAEKHLSNYRCINVMWSIHDDIRKNINDLLDSLKQGKTDLKYLNRLTGEIFYNIYSIIFREERLLYPYIQKLIPANEIEALWNESVESGFPYKNPPKKDESEILKSEMYPDLIDLKSGQLTIEQIILVFSHLPVDITFVDENDKVRFFSTPKERIFHRTNAVIGRDVHNCHPKESVYVVEKIVKAFRDCTKDRADFWISMRDGKRILIQYFAVRNEKNEYKGVIEVTQEISEIQKLEGDRRILDWEQ